MKRRMNNFFREDGKSFILALDHGGALGVLPDMNNPGEIIKKTVAGGIDGVLTTYGIAKTFQKEIANIGLMLRIDGGTSEISVTGDNTSNLYSIEDAVRIGADGIMCMGFVGGQNEDTTLKSLAYNVAMCDKYGLVSSAEMLPRGWEPVGDGRTPENISLACRIGAELGADFVKTAYTGDIDGFRKIVEGCFKPILVLGGSSLKTEKDLLQMVKDSMEAGAKGVVMGRNIWRHPNPDKLCAAITKIVHEDAEVEEALELL